MTSSTPVESRYLDYLPAIFRTSPDPDAPSFLGQFLRAFEDVLSGVGDPQAPGLSEVIYGLARDAGGATPLAGLHRYVEPGPGRSDTERAPAEFLDWLAGWVAVSLRADLDEDARREFIARAASLYRSRGTPKGLADVLRIYTRLGVTVDEGGQGFRIRDAGPTATLGVDTVLDGFVPHYFEVTLRRPPPPKATGDAQDPQLSPQEVARYRAIATAIIEAEKPAHCFYRLHIISVSLQVGVMSRVGVDTLLSGEHA